MLALIGLIVLVQVATIIGIYFLFKFLFSRQESEALKRLNILHEENLVKEQQLTDELERAKKEGDAEIKRARNEAALIIEEARNEAVHLRLKLEEQAKEQVNKIIAGGKVEAQMAMAKCLQGSQAQSLDLARQLVEQLLGEKERVSLQENFITETIAEIAKLPKEQFPAAASKVKVGSALVLSPAQKEKLQNILNEKIGRALPLEEVTKTDLVGGLVIEIDGLVIDGTLKNKLQRILPQLRKK
jgi:F0F1-type ATP synthase delta subunit